MKDSKRWKWTEENCIKNRDSMMLIDKVGWRVGRQTQGISNVGNRKIQKSNMDVMLLGEG